MVRLTDRPAMTIAVDLGCKAKNKQILILGDDFLVFLFSENVFQ